MAYVTAEARQGLLETVARAIDELGIALAALGAAYEALDEASGDRLEEAAPARPGRLRARPADPFRLRRALRAAGRTFAPASAGLPSQGVKGFLEKAVEAIVESDMLLVELQDSMAPVEVGDEQLRAGLSEVRALLADLQDRAGAVRQPLRSLSHSPTAATSAALSDFSPWSPPITTTLRSGPAGGIPKRSLLPWTTSTGTPAASSSGSRVLRSAPARAGGCSGNARQSTPTAPTAAAVRQATRAPEERPPASSGRPVSGPARSCSATADPRRVELVRAGAAERRPATR